MSSYKINTPIEYQTAWDSFLAIDAADISPKLLATIYFPQKHLPDELNYIYPKGFYYAWGFSSTNLSLFLQLNQRYGKTNPTKVSVGMAEIVGFTGLEDFGGASLAVYTLPENNVDPQQSEVLVPTIQTWLRILDDLGYPVPLDLAIALTQAYATLDNNQDVVDIYSKISGLDRDILTDAARGYAPTDPSNEAGWQPFNICTTHQQAYRDVMQQLGVSPYNPVKDSDLTVGETTLNLFANLPGVLASINQPELRVMAVRAALAQGQDASALNTTVGLGYNTYPNPFVCKPRAAQTIEERYTGREFILLNRQFKDCQEHISFALVTEDGPRPYLEKGWC